MSVSVVISTYNNPTGLRMCLLGMMSQTVLPDQIIIADDGSNQAGYGFLSEAPFSSLPIEKVWHPDRGWQKNLILNIAIRHCHGDYLIFCDGDTIPRSDFIESHLRHSRRKTFLSASALDVPQHVYKNFTDAHITDNLIFEPSFLDREWPESNKHLLRLQPGRLEKTLNLITWRYCVLRGANFSLWRDDIESVNGFDESYGYGSEDRELGVRLRNIGVSSRWLKFSLIQLHLSHSKTGYRDPHVVRMQRWKLRKLFLTRKTRVAAGLATACERSSAMPESQYVHTSEKTMTHASSILQFVPTQQHNNQPASRKRHAA
jgi:glycosyltransferase involved in cell wall biosynthesis